MNRTTRQIGKNRPATLEPAFARAITKLAAKQPQVLRDTTAILIARGNLQAAMIAATREMR